VNRKQLEHAIRAAGAIADDTELYVVGSQAILGAFPDAPEDLRVSMEVDIAPKNHPEREAVIEGSIGELSIFHETHGFYVDGVEIESITLPAGWQERLVVVDNENTNGCRGLCLGPEDLAVSKLAAGRPKDLDYVAILIREKMITPATVDAFIARVPGLSAVEQQRLHELLGAQSSLS
jgi:hypothetical protein